MSASIPEMTSEILSAYGWSETVLARRLGVSQAHVNRLKRGFVESPRYWLGLTIVDLYEKRPRPSDAA